MTHDLVVAGLSIVATVALLGMFYFMARVRSAEQATDEAFRLSKQCMDAKEAAETGFEQMKKYYDEMRKQPNLAVFTPDQLEDLAKQLGTKLFLYTSTPEGKPS